MDTPALPMTCGIASVKPVSSRASIVGLMTIGLGMSLVMVAAGSISWGDLMVLGAVGLTTAVGANEARRLVQRQEAEAEAGAATTEGVWMSVVCKPAGPADTTGVTSIPKAPPRNDPERRSLLRRARENRRAAISRR